MIDHIRAIFENGVLRPLDPLDLPENSLVELDLRESSDVATTESAPEDKIRAFDEWMNSLDPNTPGLTDDQISRESIYEEQILRQI